MYPHAEELLGWLAQLIDPSEPVRCVSWFQVNVIFEHQTRRAGVRHIKSKKQWVEGERDMKHTDFVRRTRYLADWIQGIWKHFQRPLKLLHLRPESNVLQFWTQCLALRIRSGLLQLADEVLMEAQPKVTSVRSLRHLWVIFMWLLDDNFPAIPHSWVIGTVWKAWKKRGGWLGVGVAGPYSFYRH